jgi:hypothetical protein
MAAAAFAQPNYAESCRITRGLHRKHGENKAPEHRKYTQSEMTMMERAWRQSKRRPGVTAENMMALLERWHVRGLTEDDCAEFLDRKLEAAEGKVAVHESVQDWARVESRRIELERMGPLEAA